MCMQTSDNFSRFQQHLCSSQFSYENVESFLIFYYETMQGASAGSGGGDSQPEKATNPQFFGEVQIT